MDRVYLKTLAKNKLQTSYGEILKWVFIATILSLSFFSISFDTTNGMTIQIFNLQYSIQNYKIPVLFIVISLLLVLYNLLITPIIDYGLTNKIKSYTNNTEFDFFSGFKDHYKDIIILHFIVNIKILIGFILLIIPGIIAMYKYRYVYEIYEEHPEYTYKQVMDVSENMTNGHKMDLLVLDLSFFLWMLLFGILDIFTLGIASYLLEPYTKLTNSYAYQHLKHNNQSESMNDYNSGGYNVSEGVNPVYNLNTEQE